jgi:hypothetical protein
MYVLKNNKDEVLDSLEYFHNNATKLIRSIITEKLHEGMEPEVI